VKRVGRSLTLPGAAAGRVVPVDLDTVEEGGTDEPESHAGAQRRGGSPLRRRVSWRRLLRVLIRLLHSDHSPPGVGSQWSGGSIASQPARTSTRTSPLLQRPEPVTAGCSYGA
jgi:hypothetical protein